MSQAHRLVEWNAGQLDITIGDSYTHFIRNGFNQFVDDAGDVRSVSHGLWEGTNVLPEDIREGDKIILTEWDAIDKDITLGKLYTAMISPEDGHMVFMDDVNDERDLSWGRWNATWTTERKTQQGNATVEQTPAQKRGITDGVKVRMTEGDHHHFVLHEITEIARDDGSHAPFFKARDDYHRADSCVSLSELEVLTIVPHDELIEGNRYVLVEWNSVDRDITIGKDYLIRSRHLNGNKSMIFVDDSGFDIRGIGHGVWAMAENLDYINKAHVHTLNLADAVTSLVSEGAGIGIAISPQSAEPDPSNPKVGDVFEYNAHHGYVDAFPMTHWEDGDQLEVVALREQRGKVQPIFWNKDRQSASTAVPEAYRKPDSRVETLMEEVGLTRSQAVESLRVIDRGE